MRRRAGIATVPPGWGMGASSAVAPLHAIAPGVRFALPPGQRVGPSSPMVHAAVRVDAPDMSDPRKVFGMALATLAIGIAACGNDGDNRPMAPEAASATPRAVAQDLGRYLMRRDEEPGFRPGAAPGATPRERETVTGVKALVN